MRKLLIMTVLGFFWKRLTAKRAGTSTHNTARVRPGNRIV